MSDYNTLADFRNGLYKCFGNGKDGLMDACDVLACEPNLRSFASISLSSFFGRRWPSLYEMFDDAVINQEALTRLFIQSMPPTPTGTRRLIAGDVTSILRPESPTARDRSMVHVSNLPKSAKPVLPGWQFATLVALPDKPSSWATILKNRRVPSDKKSTEAMADLMKASAPLLSKDTIVLLDGAFGNATFVNLVHEISICKLMRIANNRILYRQKNLVPLEPIEPSAKRPPGRPKSKKEETPFYLNKSETHGPPDEHCNLKDDHDRDIEVDCWHNLHFASCSNASLSVIRIARQSGPDTKRQPRIIWLVYQGPVAMPPLKEAPGCYRRRYGIEHVYRFAKQELLWTEPRLRTPEKFQTWTDILSSAYNAISIAREYHQEVRLPWAKPNVEATPQQVRAGLAPIIAKLGTPARRAQPRGKSPGRLRGAIVEKAKRYDVVVKQAVKRKQKSE